MLDHNQIQSLPETLCQLTNLRKLSASHNRCARRQHHPAYSSHCSVCQAVIPNGTRCNGLKGDNVPSRIATVSPRILRECLLLSTLLLQENPITAEQLRGAEGFAEYNARRLAKCDKQVCWTL